MALVSKSETKFKSNKTPKVNRLPEFVILERLNVYFHTLCFEKGIATGDPLPSEEMRITVNRLRKRFQNWQTGWSGWRTQCTKNSHKLLEHWQTARKSSSISRQDRARVWNSRWMNRRDIAGDVARGVRNGARELTFACRLISWTVMDKNSPVRCLKICGEDTRPVHCFQTLEMGYWAKWVASSECNVSTPLAHVVFCCCFVFIFYTRILSE